LFDNEHRIADQRIIRLIRKWLEAGVIEDGRRTSASKGTPQGAVISPLLANVYLHYAFDLWVQHWRKRPGQGDVIMVRYADHSVLGFEDVRTARVFLEDFRDRLAKFGLSLHPDKTRLIEFGRFTAERRRIREQGRPETFDFLGFTHCCGTDLHGKFLIQRVTAKKRMRATLTAIRGNLYRRRHEPVPVDRHLVAASPAWILRVLRRSDQPGAIGRLPQRGLSRLAAFFAAAKPASPAQLGALQSSRPQVHPVMPGSASLSGGAFLCVTTLGKSRMR
jgi:hypothetical protein